MSVKEGGGRWSGIWFQYTRVHVRRDDPLMLYLVLFYGFFDPFFSGVFSVVGTKGPARQ